MNRDNIYSFHSQLALPFLESDEKTLDHIFSILEQKFQLTTGSSQRFIDLGSGNGQVVIYCALNYNIHSKGIEINSHLVEESEERIEELKKENRYDKKRFKLIHIKEGDLFDQNLGGYDFIYIFSLPTMQKYLNHVFITAKKGVIFISYKYPLANFAFLEILYTTNIKIKKDEILIYFYKKV
ncbi:MAG: hypothetical protein R6W84_12155 [Promethearchaeia archaeon]